MSSASGSTRASPPYPRALRTAEQVRRILARALRLLESGKLFETEIGLGGGSGGQLTLEQAASAPPTPPESPAERPSATPEGPGEPGDMPAPPPVRRATGSGDRRGVGEIVIRALDPRLASRNAGAGSEDERTAAP